MSSLEHRNKSVWGKTLLGILGFCVFATSAFLLPDYTRAASGNGFAGVAILLPVIQEADAETEAAPAEDEPAATEGDAPAEDAEEATDEEEAEASAPEYYSKAEIDYTINTLIMQTVESGEKALG